jgi:hypothetical protein
LPVDGSIKGEEGSPMRSTVVLALAFIVVPVAVLAQTGDDGPIQDNSYFIEEAYNQEDGVVQHICNVLYEDGDDWVFSFTQEWPLTGLRHQLSYTLAYANAESLNGSSDGFGDVLVNYRYQLVGSGEESLAIAPRVSLVIPAGDEEYALGSGSTGVQLNLPISVAHSAQLVTHWNVGATFFPNARNELGDEASVTLWQVGGSAIWLANPRFNVMLEALRIGAEDVIGRDATDAHRSLIVSPGIRWAHDFPSGLQVVPGIAVPFTFDDGERNASVFLYLSFEHPLRNIIE